MPRRKGEEDAEQEQEQEKEEGVAHVAFAKSIRRARRYGSYGSNRVEVTIAGIDAPFRGEVEKKKNTT